MTAPAVNRAAKDPHDHSRVDRQPAVIDQTGAGRRLAMFREIIEHNRAGGWRKLHWAYGTETGRVTEIAPGS